MFSALLSYPTSEMRAALDEMAGLIERSPLIAPAERPGLLALIASLGEPRPGDGNGRAQTTLPCGRL